MPGWLKLVAEGRATVGQTMRNSFAKPAIECLSTLRALTEPVV